MIPISVARLYNYDLTDDEQYIKSMIDYAIMKSITNPSPYHDHQAHLAILKSRSYYLDSILSLYMSEGYTCSYISLEDNDLLEISISW